MSELVKYYAQIDQSNGTVALVYTNETHGGQVFFGSEQITESQYKELIDKIDKGYTAHFTTGVFTYIHPVWSDLEVAKQKRLAEINKAADDVIDIFLSTYPSSEALSWTIQESEARAYVADPTPETEATLRMLPKIAQERSLGLLDLCERVIYKSDLFAVISGLTFGRRQMYEDYLATVTEVHELEEMVIDFSDIIGIVVQS